MGNAQKLFEEMRDGDVVSWSWMVVGFASARLVFEAMDLFRRLQCEGGGFECHDCCIAGQSVLYTF